MSKAQYIASKLLEADPDELDPKGEFMRVEPSMEHWLKRKGFVTRPGSNWMEKTFYAGVAEVRPQRSGKYDFVFAPSVDIYGPAHFMELDDDELKFKLADYQAVDSVFESGPDEIDPKSEFMALDPLKAMYSQIAPPSSGWASLQVVLKPSMRQGEWVTRIKNADNGGESWGHYFMDYAEAVKDFQVRCAKYGLPPEPMETKAVFEEGPDEVDPRDYLRALHGRDPRITITFSRTTPESSAEGDVSDSGWIDEEGVSMWPDLIDHEEGIGPVDLAVKFLQNEGATQPSSSNFYPGVWYSTGYETVDYSTGEDEERNYHLHGFLPEEEREIWDKVHSA